MKLISLQIKNYRNFEDSGVIPYHDLTIFVGENGSGKTSAIDALELLLDHKTKKPVIDELINKEQVAEVEGVFSVPPDTPDRPADNYLVDDLLTLRYTFNPSNGLVEYSVKCSKYVDDQFNTYHSFSAVELKDLVRGIGNTAGSTKAANISIIEGYLRDAALETEEGYKVIAWNEVGAYMPILQRYSSLDYGRPENIVSKTLSTLYRAHFYETNAESGDETLKQDFVALKNSIESDLNSNINTQLMDRLSRQLEHITYVGGDFDIDFSRGFTLRDISITYENGTTKTIDQLGDGHKKKAALAVLEWDAEVSASLEGQAIIKAYDEPDANLDFPAQRKIFNTISQDVQDHSHVSAVICTHSLALIDRASAESINRVVLEDERATIEHLISNGDDDIRQFLSEVAGVSGLRNSSIFYEKAFLVVEGESEEGSIGILYKTYTGRTMPEDGIVLINIMTNGQWNRVLKFLSTNKSTCTVILLDADTQYPNSDCQVTQQKLTDSGFNSDFLTNQCFFIGTKEFEDTYSDADLASMANSKFPKADGTTWTDHDFTALRGADKFSEELSILITREHGNGRVSKPMIAHEIAHMYDMTKISQNTVLRDLFDKLQEVISG